MKIGVFGGCFNPPHKAHKKIALELVEKGYVDKVIFVPVASDYEKDGLISFEYRFNMLEIMVKNQSSVEVSSIGSTPNGQYTYQVLDALQEKYPNDELYFVCGTDNLKQFDTWKRFEYILEKYKLMVIRRSGYEVDSVMEKYHGCESNIVLCDIELEAFSSTLIRHYLFNGDVAAKKILDMEVLEYIDKEKLYKRKESL